MSYLWLLRKVNWERFSGMASAIGLLLVLAIISWTGIAGPVWRSYWTATPDQWLGFAGNVLGGFATFLAAIIAWFAVQLQVKETRRAAEQQRKDVANDRLTTHTSTIFIARSEQAQVIQASSEADKEMLYQRFEKYRVSPPVLAMLGDPLLGKDNVAVAFFMNALRNEAGGFVGRFSKEQVGNPAKAIERLHERLHEMISERRAIMATATVDDLTGLKLIRLKPYRRMIKTGASVLIDDGTDD